MSNRINKLKMASKVLKDRLGIDIPENFLESLNDSVRSKDQLKSKIAKTSIDFIIYVATTTKVQKWVLKSEENRKKTEETIFALTEI